MRVNTKVLIDLVSGRVLERESHEWHGPVAEAKGGGSSSKTVQTQSPPSYVMPWITQQLQATGDYYGDALQDPSRLVAPLQAPTLSALDIMRKNVAGGAAADSLDRTLSGYYAPGGEGYRGAVAGARGDVSAAVNRAFGGNTSNAAAPAVSGEVADSFALRSPQERANMMRALGMAPGVAPLRYASLLQAGDIQDAQRQSELLAPREALQQYHSLIAPYLGAGGVATGTSTPGGISGAQRALGAASIGAGIYSRMRGGGGGYGPQYTGTGPEGLLSSGSF